MARQPPKQGADKARMTRKQPVGATPGRRSEDPKEAYTTAQLAEVGAVVLIWNQINTFVDWLLHMALVLPHSMFWEVGPRIALENKINLLRIRAERSRLLNDDARACIKYSLDAIQEYNTFRNRIVHSVPFDADLGIAHMTSPRAEMHQVLVTTEALSALYQRMKLLLGELREIDVLYRLADDRSTHNARLRTISDPRERQRLLTVPVHIARVQEVQKARRSLPPLPLFPEDPAIPTE
jgi:hypothetical protein